MAEFSTKAGGAAWDPLLLLRGGISLYCRNCYHDAIKLFALGNASCSGDRLIKPDFPVDIGQMLALRAYMVSSQVFPNLQMSQNPKPC